MEYYGLGITASIVCFLLLVLLFAFLEQNNLLRCLQFSVAVIVFPTNNLGAWIEAV
jgi:hypothetical protein